MKLNVHHYEFGLQASTDFGANSWVFYTLYPSTQNKALGLGTSRMFCPAMWLCVYVLILAVIATCLNFSCLMFASILSDSFLLLFSFSLRPRLSQPFIPSVCSRTSLWEFSAHRETGGNMHIDCVCLCVYGCCFRYASAVIPCVWCARWGRQQWCVNKSSIFNLSSQVEMPSATAGTHTHTHTHTHTYTEKKLQPNQLEKQAHTFTSDTLSTFSRNTEMDTLSCWEHHNVSIICSHVYSPGVPKSHAACSMQKCQSITDYQITCEC